MDGLNCPNCGAPLGELDVCEYCGTHVMDCTMQIDKPFYIKIRHGNKLIIDKVYLTDARVNFKSDDFGYYRDVDGRIASVKSNRYREYEISLTSVGESNVR